MTNNNITLSSMGSSISRQDPSKSDVIVLVEKDDDRIVLVEQMWKYKRDLTRFIGIKHAFIVTTTMKGKRTKRDLILNRRASGSERVVGYSNITPQDHVWNRIKINPEITEEELQNKLNQMNKEYCVTENNCWHYSNNVLQVLTGNDEPHPYNFAMNSFKTLTSPFVTYDHLKAFNKSISELIAN